MPATAHVMESGGVESGSVASGGASHEVSPATAARHGGAVELAAALRASRADTLAAFAAWQAVGRLAVPERPTLNPPLWELGHVGWFQRWWAGRNPERARGVQADPDAPRPPSPLDALYHSSLVPHAARLRRAARAATAAVA